MKKNFLKPIAIIFLLAISSIVLTSGVSTIRGGDYGNLVDELYKQEVAKSATLESIETAIKNYVKKKEQVTDEYNKFNNYNRKYYYDAGLKAGSITENALKEKANNIITQSEKKYNARVSEYTRLIAEMSNNEANLRNLQALLKIMITAPIIEQYQNKELPKINPIQESNDELKKIIESIKTITDK